MAAKPKPGRDLADAAGRVALYARVSTEDQAERQTVQGQLGFLRQLAAVHQWPVASEYVDDGISGTVPLAQRPGGARLLADAAAGVFQTVVFYRLDRLGRKVEVLLDAHTALDAVGCVLKSGTEPFDTSNAIGRFVFQLLGSIAELERSTITERMTMGRDRVAKAGKWTGGPVPFGYDVDAGGCLQPSARLVPGIDRTEAAIAVEVFERLAAGTSATEEARRLQALGVPCERRYAGGKVYAPTGTWRPGRLAQMIHNPLYEGRHVLRSAHGAVERPVPALISAAVRAAACAQLERNRRLSKRNARDQYLLRGLITCECGRGFHGQPVHSTGKIVRYYRCSGQGGSVQPDRTRRCNAKRLPADRLEDEIWQMCRDFVANPGEPLAEARRRLLAARGQATRRAAERQGLEHQLSAKGAERERVRDLYRKGLISGVEAEADLARTAMEADQLRRLLDALDSEAALAQAAEAHLENAAALLATLRDQVEEIERTGDWARKRQTVELLVQRVAVETAGQGRSKRAKVNVTYAFAASHAVVSDKHPRTAPCGPWPSPGSRR